MWNREIVKEQKCKDLCRGNEINLNEYTVYKCTL